MRFSPMVRPGRAVAFALLMLTSLVNGHVHAQELVERDTDLQDRPMSAVRLQGVSEVTRQLALNNIRAAVGEPYSDEVVRADVNRLYDLGRFSTVTAQAMLADDGGVIVVYELGVEAPITAIEFRGNKALRQRDIRGVVRLVPGGIRDAYLIEKAKRDIKALYRERGFYLTEVREEEDDEQEGAIVFQIVEGPRVRVKAVEFEGVTAFDRKQLLGEIKTRSHVPVFRAGILDEDIIGADRAALDRFYKDRGYLDVRVGSTIDLSPDNREAKVIYILAEGPRYELRSVRTENSADPDSPLEVFSAEQIAALLDLKTGDVYRRDKLRKSLEILEESYGRLGYLDVRIVPYELRSGTAPEVDLLLEIIEGESYKVGLVQINGNFLTKDKVVRRLIRLKPGRPYDATELEESRQRIRQTRLFGDARLTVQPPDPVDPEYRDLLVEVKEQDTGSVNFGLAVGSDSGLFGDFSVIQRNFDIADVPETLSEMVSGRAFRGAGQQFSMILRPGNEIFQYSISLTEPHIFESDYAFTVSGAYRTRQFEDYDEERIGGTVRLSRSLGDIWDFSVAGRFERIRLDDIEVDAPVDIFEDAGPDTLTSLGLSLTRTTLSSFTRPGRGSRLELGLETIGAFGGDKSFFKSSIDYTLYLTLAEDFLGRKSTLRMDSRIGYIFGSDRAPTYERFYLGGRSFRGFEFRTVSPKGIRNDTGMLGTDPVGGEWLFFVGGQYETPLIEETVTGVLFLDTGTVTPDVGFDDYRVAAGFGVRLYIPQLGPVPIAFDFGFPIVSEDSDEEQVLSFSAELPF